VKHAVDTVATEPTFDLAGIDRLLTTTKSVSRRLDLDRPVPLDLVLECIRIASHAPMGGNREAARWMVISDAETKREIAEIYASVGRPHIAAKRADVEPGSRGERILTSGAYLVDHLHEVPVLVLALRLGRSDGGRGDDGRGDDVRVGDDPQSFFGSVIPAVWNFQLAARARGLGSRYTTFTTRRQAEMAALLGIPDDVTQVALLPVAYHRGGDFRPAPRLPVQEVTFLDRWGRPPPR